MPNQQKSEPASGAAPAEPLTDLIAQLRREFGIQPERKQAAMDAIIEGLQDARAQLTAQQAVIRELSDEFETFGLSARFVEQIAALRARLLRAEGGSK